MRRYVNKAGKNLLLFVVLFCALFSVSAQQNEPWLWPICGQKTGEGIISKPQQYIDKELNFNDLFIEAKEGAPVISPVDGILEDWGVVIFHNLQSTTSWYDFKNGDSFNSAKKRVLSSKKEDPFEKYYSGTISINFGKKILSIEGLSGDIAHKSGQKIKRGDTLGFVAYAYKKISQPHIKLSVYEKGGMVQDPMTPFGLKSSFIPPQKVTKPEYLSSVQAKEDLEIILTAFRESFPSADEFITEEQVQNFKKEAFDQIGEGVSYEQFHNIIRSACSAKLYHDTHIDILTPLQRKETLFVPHLGFGAIGDTLRVCQVQPGFENYIGKIAQRIDDVPAQELIEKVREEFCVGFDGKNSSVRDSYMLTAWNYWFFNDVYKPRKSVVLFDDGSQYIDEWTIAATTKVVPMRSIKIARYKNIMESSKNKIHFNLLNDSTLYFALSSFDINDVEMELIADSIGKYSNIPNMIIDVRNNPGGESRNVDKLVSFFIQKPTINLNSYEKVIIDSTCTTLKYSINYTKDLINDALLEGFEKREGYYYKSTNSVIEPDNIINYFGKLYILTDETSVSAATMFPSILVRNNRAVTVGRETASGYHFITALKFTDIMLPNSRIVVRIPLVKSVFDEQITERTPANRGLMPDYEVPITYDEFFLSEKDLILKHALELIREGKYLKSDQFIEIENKQINFRNIALAVSAIVLFCGILIFYLKRNKSLKN